MAKTSEAGTPELVAISEQFRDAAQRLGLSQNQVARLSGVSRKHVGVAFSGGNISVSVRRAVGDATRSFAGSAASALHQRDAACGCH